MIDLKNSIKIMKKDWKVSLRNKQISIPMFIIPIIFTVVMPILMLIGVLFEPDEYIGAFGGYDNLSSLTNLPQNTNKYLLAADITAKLLLLPYFLFIPSMITIVLASDSFAGEKDRKTMESIALLPITKTELIFGKVLAAFIPAIILSFIFFIAQGIIVNVMFLPYLEGNILIFLDLSWLFTILFLTPTISFLNILIGTIVSSRTKDFKSAQSINGSLIVPLLILMFAQMINPAFLSPLMILIFSGIFGLLCVLFIKLANKLLDIEKLILML